MRTAAFCVKVDDDVVEALAHSASCALTKSSIDLLVADGNRFLIFQEVIFQDICGINQMRC